MTDNLNAMSGLDRAMAVMKMEPIGLDRIDHFDLPAQLPIVVTGDYNDFAALTELSQKLPGFARRGFVMHEITENNKAFGRVSIDQLGQAFRDRRHSPHRDEGASRALAKFVAEMEVRHGQPALAFVKKAEPPIKNNFFGHQGLIRAQCCHGHEFGCSNYRLRAVVAIAIEALSVSK